MLAACTHAQDFGTSRLKGGYAKSSWFHSTLQPPIGGGRHDPGVHSRGRRWVECENLAAYVGRSTLDSRHCSSRLARHLSIGVPIVGAVAHEACSSRVGAVVPDAGTACRAASAMMRSSRRPKITPLEMTRASTRWSANCAKAAVAVQPIRKPAIGWADQHS
jgi:hypothetical protein